MNTVQLIEKLRRPIHNYNMAMHQGSKGHTRREIALQEIDDIVLVYVIGNDELRKVVVSAAR